MEKKMTDKVEFEGGKFAIGVDDNDNDKFKISNGKILGTNNRIWLSS